jgi:hypothetical protein
MDGNPSLRQAKELVATVVDAAWTEPPTSPDADASQTEPSGPGAPRGSNAAAEPVAETVVVSFPMVESPTPVSERPGLAEMTSEVPTPGYFYRVRAEDELLGEAGIAARAVHTAALAAAQARGWPTNKVEARARKFASKPRIQKAYAELVAESDWNAGRVEPLVEGTLLWLPPLRQFSLMDRSRQREIHVETRPWPDGSSKLAPPPWLRETLASSEALATSGGRQRIMHH